MVAPWLSITQTYQDLTSSHERVCNASKDRAKTAWRIAEIVFSDLHLPAVVAI